MTETTTPGESDARRADGKAEARLLAEVRALAVELRPHLASAPVTLDSALDKDLGFDSLGRVELMVRVERTFGVTLPEHVFADTETPRDLLRAVTTAAAAGTAAVPAAGVGGAGEDARSLAEAARAPAAAGTLTAVLDWHADAHGDRPHIRLYGERGLGAAITYHDLRRDALRVAAGLQAGGVEPGETVVLMLPTGCDYFAAFFGALYAGAVPVPVYPPGRPQQLEDHLKRHVAIMKNCRGRALVTVAEAKPFAKLLAGLVDTLREIVTVEELEARGGQARSPVLKTGDLAFIQYTSGSTGDPKGVALSHANLLANIRAMGEALETTPGDVFVSWLPLYHDMGLIGAWLGNLYFANLLVIMSPLAFLSRPERWLRAIHETGATLSAGPNFAFELCLSRIKDSDIEGVDLSTWRAAMNGAEAVNPRTLERFCERFAAFGFRREAMMPVFGLAENAVGLAFPPLGRGPVVDRVRRGAFQKTGRAEPAAADEANALVFINCGRPIPRHQIRVVDADGRELPEREEGRLQFKGPSATAGYFRNPEASAALFDGDWLNAGDLAYIAGGDLHVTGRTKDVIIRAGRNVYPAELEDAVGSLDGVARGNVAVFGSVDPESGTERLVVLAETRKRDEAARDRLRARINELAVDLVGMPADEVVLAPPRTVLKTSSGKVRRAACRDVYEKGLIGKPAAAIWWQVVRAALSSFGPRLRRGARRAGLWAFGVYAWVLVATFGPVIWTGALVLPTEAVRWRLLAPLFRLVGRLLGLGLTVEGRENLPPGGVPAVVVSNHASYIDGFVLGGVLPRPVSFVVKGELAQSWATRLPLAAIGAAFVERFDRGKGAEDAKRVVAALRRGTTPMFFPEGTLTRMPGLLPFHMGAFVAAVEAGVPVVPVVIRGTRSILRDGTWLPRPGAITVGIGRPIPPPAGDGGDSWRRAVKLRDAVRAEILRHIGEPDLAREDVFAAAVEGPG